MLTLSPGLIGRTAGPVLHEIDARWLMAYAAALGETDPERFDTRRPGGPVAHPLFPVCYEWPLAQALREAVLPPALAVRAVHATHDLRLHRLPAAGDRLRSSATVLAVAPRRAGTCLLTRFETVDAAGQPVTTTDHGTLYRGVGDPGGGAGDSTGAAAPLPPAGPPGEPIWSEPLEISPRLGHVYAECARIWNPIHTDLAVAHAAGLPQPILHGTATLALAVSSLLRREGRAGLLAVVRIACRFTAMVVMPSTLWVESRGTLLTPGARWIRFTARGADGRTAITDGWLGLAGAAAT